MKSFEELREECWNISENILDSRFKDITDYLKYKSLEKAEGRIHNMDAYGFIKPNGEFIDIKYGYHCEYCRNLLELNKEMMAERRKAINNREISGSSYLTDYFVEVLGWVLLHSPEMDELRIEFSKTKPLTKAQKETLYDYYLIYRDHCSEPKKMEEKIMILIKS